MEFSASVDDVNPALDISSTISIATCTFEMNQTYISFSEIFCQINNNKNSKLYGYTLDKKNVSLSSIIHMT